MWFCSSKEHHSALCIALIHTVQGSSKLRRVSKRHPAAARSQNIQFWEHKQADCILCTLDLLHMLPENCLETHLQQPVFHLLPRGLQLAAAAVAAACATRTLCASRNKGAAPACQQGQNAVTQYARGVVPLATAAGAQHQPLRQAGMM